MKKYIVLIGMLILSLGCSKDDDTEAVDDSLFLAKYIPSFSGKINDSKRNWEFGFNTYQMATYSLYVGGDSSDPRRAHHFVLNAENGNNQFIISCPSYDISSETQYKQVFGNGLKGLGESPGKYHIQMRDNDTKYNLCNSNSTYRIEVLKSQEYNEGNQMQLKVWYKIKQINSENCSGGQPFVMKDINIIAYFIDYKNF